jgi:hypothetical protein
MARKPDKIEPIETDFDSLVETVVEAHKSPSTDGPIPKAIADGFLEIGDKSLPCAVLDDVHNTRVLTQEGFLTSIGRAGKAKGGEGSTVDGMPPFLRAKNLIPFIDSNLVRSTEPIVYETMRGQRAFGYRATLLPSVCWVYQDALLSEKLLPSQEHIAKACTKLLRGLTDRAINDMVDEATGFRSLQRRKVLEEVLREYVAPEALPWALTFDDELYMNIFRLNGWEFTESSIKKRPGVVGRWTNDFYERLAPGVLAEIQRTVPRDTKGRPKVRYHQMLTEHVGHPKLREFLEGVKALMRISPDWETFQGHLSRAYPHYDEQLQLTFLDKLRITG